VSNGKPIKEILPEVIRKLIIQRKHYLKQQRINRNKKNRDPNQPPLPGMKQGGVMASKEVYELATKLKNKDRLTSRDIERAEKLTKSFGKGKGKSSRGKGPHARSIEELLKEAYPGQFRNESNALAPEFHTKGRARGGFVKKAGGTKRVPGSGAATKGTNFEGIF